MSTVDAKYTASAGPRMLVLTAGGCVLFVLQTQLPEIFTEAYASKEDKQAPVTLWGVQIDPANPRDARVSVVLVKFLRARSTSVPALLPRVCHCADASVSGRDLKVADARKMLADTLKWREDFKLTEVLKEEFPEDVFGNLGRIYGKDKEGHPVVYVVPRLCSRSRVQPWECIRRHADVRVRYPGITSTAETKT